MHNPHLNAVRGVLAAVPPGRLNACVVDQHMERVALLLVLVDHLADGPEQHTSRCTLVLGWVPFLLLLMMHRPTHHPGGCKDGSLAIGECHDMQHACSRTSKC